MSNKILNLYRRHDGCVHLLWLGMISYPIVGVVVPTNIQDIFTNPEKYIGKIEIMIL